MTLKELKAICKDGKKETRHYIRGCTAKVNLKKIEITKNLPINERKKLMNEEWREYCKSKKQFYYDNLYYKLCEEYNLIE